MVMYIIHWQSYKPQPIKYTSSPRESQRIEDVPVKDRSLLYEGNDGDTENDSSTDMYASDNFDADGYHRVGFIQLYDKKVFESEF